MECPLGIVQVERGKSRDIGIETRSVACFFPTLLTGCVTDGAGGKGLGVNEVKS